jgi:hypothetical protein
VDDLSDEDLRELFESEPWPRPGERIGPYVVDDDGGRSGQGGRLADGDEGRVVLKLGLPGDVRRISAVIAAVRALAHPNILTVHAGSCSRTRGGEIGWLAVAPYGEDIRVWSCSRPWTAVVTVLRVVAATLAVAEDAGRGECVPFESDIRVGPDLDVRVDVAAGVLRADRMRRTPTQVGFCQVAWRSLRGAYPPRRERLAETPFVADAELPAWVRELLERGAYGAPWPSMAALAAALEPAPRR